MLKFVLAFTLILNSCSTHDPYTIKKENEANKQVVITTASNTDTSELPKPNFEKGNLGDTIHTGTATPTQLLQFAKSLQGIPYKYGSINPAEGFDCSGFITYVFSHFDISVPRTSAGFTNVGKPIKLKQALPGDIILYTGTDSTIPEVGHMGIITSNQNGALYFIHSTSGRADGVTITPLNPYYMSRFVKVIRIFKQNDHQ